MKKFILLTLLFTIMPAFADDINLTPQNKFSGYNNQSTVRPMYPQLRKMPVTTSDRTDIMRAKSVREMGDTNPVNDGKSPMTYSQFPQHYDSSNMLHSQGLQGGMQSIMGY